MKMKRCIACHAECPLDQFNKNRSRADGLQDRCRGCDNARARIYYAANGERQRQQIGVANTRRRQVVRQNLWDYYLEHPCVDCGEADPIVLDSDHLGDKVLAISLAMGRGWGWSKILIELKKCETRCSNCHRRKTARDFGWYKDQVIPA